MPRRWITDSLAQLKDKGSEASAPCPTNDYTVTITGTNGREARLIQHRCALLRRAMLVSSTASDAAA